jgi:hypothetical protein
MFSAGNILEAIQFLLLSELDDEDMRRSFSEQMQTQKNTLEEQNHADDFNMIQQTQGPRVSEEVKLKIQFQILYRVDVTGERVKKPNF